MRDYLGQNLSVGDSVAYIHRTDTSAFFLSGVVVGFNARKEKPIVDIRITAQGMSKIVRVFPYKVIKFDNKQLQRGMNYEGA